MNRDQFRMMERRLYDYRKNLSRIQLLRSELQDIHAHGDIHVQTYGDTHTLGVHDPISEHFNRIRTLEVRIRTLERKTLPLVYLHEDLAADTSHPDSRRALMLKVFDLVYLDWNTFDYVAHELKVSRRTVYSLRHELVNLAFKYSCDVPKFA